MGAFVKFSVKLTNPQGEALFLKYKLNDTPMSALWFEQILQARKVSRISETRLYNFPNNIECNLDELVKRLRESIRLLSGPFPEVLHDPLDSTTIDTLQDSLNLLHRNFAHNHLIEKRVTPENQGLWHEFNSLIHRVESQIITEKYPPPNGLHRGRIEFAWYSWNNYCRNPIPEHGYKEFRLRRNFGDINLRYCQVGRHLAELYYSQDTDIPIEHIQPYRYYSANAGINFGPPVEAIMEQRELKRIEAWFRQHEKKFNDAGVFWENDNKAVGSIYVAELAEPPVTLDEMQALQLEVGRYNQVADILPEE